MKIIKRDGKEVDFNVDKIFAAIQKANEAGIGTPELSLSEVGNVTANVHQAVMDLNHTSSVEEVQELVETALMKAGAYETAKRYIRYRYNRSLARRANTTDERILNLINCCNEEVKQENSNKNPVVNSTQRDYMAGEVSRDITERLLLPSDIVEAHKDGIIHFHDSDYFAQHMHNCFTGDTLFVTDGGVKSFAECGENAYVNVLDCNGEWREAVVRKYGKQSMQEVTLKSGRTVKTIRCTKDHRWILKNGAITTSLKVGDRLTLLEPLRTTDKLNNDLWCLGFIIGDGTVRHNNAKPYTIVRLCGKKRRYLQRFINSGFSVSKQKLGNTDDVIVTKSGFIDKQGFLDDKAWQYLSGNDLRSLFEGYYAADGDSNRNFTATSDHRIAEMICDISAVAGYHVTRCDYVRRSTPYKNDAHLYQIGFMVSQPTNRNWVVMDIVPTRHKYDAWCVEEPVTKTFTLYGGIVTGNCDLVNLEDMLQNGTVISGTLIERPHSFSTACNIATQIIAQVASNQYGGQSISLTHLAPFVDVSRKAIHKALEENLTSVGLEVSPEQLDILTEKQLRKEIKSGVQTIQYQILTLLTTNGQTPFVTIYMYLNEARSEQEKADLAVIIQETLEQRYQGVKNESGVWITPAFPKLIYVVEEDNYCEGTPYFHLTELAAKCTARRMVPDYISEKEMLELKGDVYTCINKICA